jgi:hypothetical protein
MTRRSGTYPCCRPPCRFSIAVAKSLLQWPPSGQLLGTAIRFGPFEWTRRALRSRTASFVAVGISGASVRSTTSVITSASSRCFVTINMWPPDSAQCSTPARPGSSALNMDKIREYFEARCRSLYMIPFDPHLAEGADTDFGMLKPETAQAYLELAGAIAEFFPRLRGPREHRGLLRKLTRVSGFGSADPAPASGSASEAARSQVRRVEPRVTR